MPWQSPLAYIEPSSKFLLKMFQDKGAVHKGCPQKGSF